MCTRLGEISILAKFHAIDLTTSLIKSKTSILTTFFRTETCHESRLLCRYESPENRTRLEYGTRSGSFNCPLGSQCASKRRRNRYGRRRKPKKTKTKKKQKNKTKKTKKTKKTTKTKIQKNKIWGTSLLENCFFWFLFFLFFCFFRF